MIIVDSHCHLDMLNDYDSTDNIVNRAKEFGVKYLQTICTRLDNFENILSIAKKFDNVYASVGVHPSEVETITSYAELLRLSSDDKVIGLGETGLDYFYNKDAQHHLLQSQRQLLIAMCGLRLIRPGMHVFQLEIRMDGATRRSQF